MSKYAASYQEHTGSRPEKFFKSTLFQGEYMMLGLNCLEPGQVQPMHDHADQDKFYFVLEGTGLFTVGAERIEAGPGQAIWAPVGVVHGVENRGSVRLTMLVGIAPPPR